MLQYLSTVFYKTPANDWFLVSREDPIIYGRIFPALSVILIFEYSLQYMSREEW